MTHPIAFSSTGKHFVRYQSLQNLVKMLRWDLGFCTSNRIPADVNAADLQTTLWMAKVHNTHNYIEMYVCVVMYVYVFFSFFFSFGNRVFSKEIKTILITLFLLSVTQKNIWSHVCLGNTPFQLPSATYLSCQLQFHSLQPIGIFIANSSNKNHCTKEKPWLDWDLWVRSRKEPRAELTGKRALILVNSINTY